MIIEGKSYAISIQPSACVQRRYQKSNKNINNVSSKELQM